ncbi:MAG: RluA family pseudouridine synthase [Acidimicrobiales bacterium]|nr:RluA family pseudouridine synthase [Acidimicrobiales bacterium]
MIESVPEALAGERLDRVVSLLTGCSRSEAAGLVADGAVQVDGDVVRAKAHRLRAGEVVAVAWAPPAALGLVGDPAVAVDVVYADDDVIVVDKPPGLVVHPGAGNDRGTLVQGLLARYPELAGVGAPERPGIVHRIDKETSGLLVVARTPAAHQGLVAQLAARTVERRYTALVWGAFDEPAGLVEAPIGRSGRDPTRMTVTERGRPATTRYAVEVTFQAPVVVSRLACRLLTGRTHQIRVHLRAIGHPVVGDDRYGGVRESLVVPRLFLHAAHLGFEHPTRGGHLAFDAPLPADLTDVLARLS